MKIKFDQIIVLFILVACFVLIVTGINGEVKTTFALCCGWVFRGVYGAVKNKVHPLD